MEENKTTEMTRMPAHNSSLAKGGLTYFIETFVLGSTFVLRMNFCAKNPALRQAANRYMQCCQRGYKNQSIAKQN